MDARPEDMSVTPVAQPLSGASPASMRAHALETAPALAGLKLARAAGQIHRASFSAPNCNAEQHHAVERDGFHESIFSCLVEDKPRYRIAQGTKAGHTARCRDRRNAFAGMARPSGGALFGWQDREPDLHGSCAAHLDRQRTGFKVVPRAHADAGATLGAALRRGSDCLAVLNRVDPRRL
jgi:hypothetical protein